MKRPLAARLIAAALAAISFASCASNATTSPASTPATSPSPGSTPTGPETAGPETAGSETTGVAAVPEPEVDLPPAALALSGTLDEQAVAVADALSDPSTDRNRAVLAAFAASGLPVVLDDGTSLTSTPDIVGFPWSIVSSLTNLSSPLTRVSLAQSVALFGLIDPATPFDSAAASQQLVDGLRAALASGQPSGPAFLAHLVAEQARRVNGAELSDPTVTADQLFVSTTTSMLIDGAALRAVFSGLAEAGQLGDPAAASESGPSRVVHAPQGVTEGGFEDSGCDDGENGWVLWTISKIAAGAPLAPTLGLEWKGIYTVLTQYAVDHGVVVEEALGVPKFFGKAAGIAGALINVLLFEQQVAGRSASATMDGTGPLVRTKTTGADGSARTISLSIFTEAGDPKVVAQRNCILFALGAIGSNAQQAIGANAGVEVETVGDKGFTTNLAAGSSIVLFGPATFQPVQTADANGTITVPVQGRRQKVDRSEATQEVPKEFSLEFSASLDPTGASQIGRSFADDLLCTGVISLGDAVDAIAECQNAVIDIVKQFHWDLGEFTFPLTDWDNSGWKADVSVPPYRITTLKCDGSDGAWSLDLSASLPAAYNATVIAEVDPSTHEGAFSLSGSASGGGITVPISGYGTFKFVEDPDGLAHLEVHGAQFGPHGAGGEAGGFDNIPLTPTDPGDC